MGREEKEQIIILKTYKVGEIHRGVRLLTDKGVLSALVYGGNGKNSLKKGAIIPFCYGQGELVHNRGRDSYQLKEFSVEISFDGVREDLKKMYMASLWAEVILSSYGGGQQGEILFSLMLNSLDLLQGAEGNLVVDRVMVRFIWFFLELSGERPNLSRCSTCGNSLQGNLYRDRRGLLHCSSCSSYDMGKLSGGVVPYLTRIDQVSGEDFLKIGVARQTMEQLKRWLYLVLQDHMVYPLKTLKTGSFVL